MGASKVCATVPEERVGETKQSAILHLFSKRYTARCRAERFDVGVLLQLRPLRFIEVDLLNARRRHAAQESSSSEVTNFLSLYFSMS